MEFFWWGNIWGHSRFLKSVEVIFGLFWGYSKFLNPFEVMFEVMFKVILDVIQDFWSQMRSFLRPYTAFESNNCRCTFIRYFRVGLGFSNSAVETNKSAKKKRSGNDFRSSSRFFSILYSYFCCIQLLWVCVISDTCPLENVTTVFENYWKSRIQHCERSELCLHFWTKVH